MSQERRFYDHDTEKALLGALLMSPEKIGDMDGLRPADFHDERHGWIYDAMRTIADDGGAFEDLAHLAGTLDKAGHLAELENGGYLSELLALHPSPVNVPSHAEKIRDLADKRALYREAQDVLVRLKNGDLDDMPADLIRDDLTRRLQDKIRTPSHLLPQAVWTARELMRAEFAEPRWTIPGLLPVGLDWLAGRPKVGKSWLALQIAHAVGIGGKVLGTSISRGKVLYIAYEDSARRLQSRFKKQGGTADSDITFVTAWPIADHGGLTKLPSAIAKEGYTLVVIDTFSRWAGMRDQRDLAQMTTLCGELQATATDADIAILVVDHHRKSSGFAPDPIDDIMESTGKGAVVDTAWGLYRDAGKQTVTLMIRGRDLEERELALQWDGLTCTWQYQGDAGQVRHDSLKGQILQKIAQMDTLGEMATSTTIAKHLGKDRGNVASALADLLNDGEVVKLEKEGKSQPYGIAHR